MSLFAKVKLQNCHFLSHIIHILFTLKMEDPFISIADEAMNHIWGRKPQFYQSHVICHILCMMAKHNNPEPILLVQCTGSGKSFMPLTCAVVNGGVSIINKNTLVLLSDQASKVTLQANTKTKKVRAFQLDLFKTSQQQNQLSLFIIDHCTQNSDTSILLFTSPETL